MAWQGRHWPRNPSRAELSFCDPFCLLDLALQIPPAAMFTLGFGPPEAAPVGSGPASNWGLGAHPFPPGQILSALGFIMKFSHSCSTVELSAHLLLPTCLPISLIPCRASPSDCTPVGHPGKPCLKELASWLSFGAGTQPQQSVALSLLTLSCLLASGAFLDPTELPSALSR